MSNNKQEDGLLAKIILPVVAALLTAGTAPWWLSLITITDRPPPVPTRKYKTIFTTDGITTVRKTPSGKSEPVVDLKNPGTLVLCEKKARDGENVNLKQGVSNKWRYCPEVGGYISDVLLSPVEE